MKLLPKKLERILPSIQSIEGIEQKNLKIFAHYYNPVGEGDWFVFAGERSENDYKFFGVQILDEFSIGCFTLKDLESIRLPLGERIKRSESFEIITFDELKENLHLLLD